MKTNLTITGLDAQNFEKLKASLTISLARELGVSEDEVVLTQMKKSENSFPGFVNPYTVVIATVFFSNKEERKKELEVMYNTTLFVNTLNKEMQNQSALKLINVTAASKPTVEYFTGKSGYYNFLFC